MSHCQVCLHPYPGHEEGCPVLTGEPVSGRISNQALESQLEARLAKIELEIKQLKEVAVLLRDLSKVQDQRIANLENALQSGVWHPPK
jgi:hypothetical protein